MAAPQTIEKGRSTASKRRKTKILLKMKDNISIRIMARISSREPRHYLLSTNTNSTVPTYADEFVFVEYTYLLSKSISACRSFCPQGTPSTRGRGCQKVAAPCVCGKPAFFVQPKRGYSKMYYICYTLCIVYLYG